MGLLDRFTGGSDESDESDDGLSDEQKRQLATSGGFTHYGWYAGNGIRVIDWEAEVVIYHFYTSEYQWEFNDAGYNNEPGGFGWGAGGGGLAAVPLAQTAIDPDDYADPRGMTWEEIEQSSKTT